MQKGQWRILTILALGVSAGLPSHAQQKSLTLEQAKQIALERNLTIVQAENNIASAQGGVLAAYGSYLPTVSASGGWNRTKNEGAQVVEGQLIPGSSLSNFFSSRVDVNYTVFDWFGREANFARASANAVSIEQQAARSRQSIIFQVESAYMDVLRTEQLVKVSEGNLKRDMRQLERITESNRVGALSLADVYRQQSQVAADELNLITAQNDYDKTKADLLALVGLDVWEDYKFLDTTISPEISEQELVATAENYKNYEELGKRALQARPDYLGAAENLRGAESGVTGARSGYFPSVGAFAGYAISNNPSITNEISGIANNRNLSWGISIRWNLFDGFQTNQALQSALVTRRNAEVFITQSERNIYVELRKALLDLEAARKQYEVSQKGLLSATEDRKIAEERYNLGAGTLLDLLTGNAGLVNAEANKVNAVYNYIVAQRRVEYVIGERTY